MRETSTSLPPLDERQRYDIQEAAAYLRCSRSKLYEHIADGKIRPIKEGRRVYIPGTDIARLSCVPEVVR